MKKSFLFSLVFVAQVFTSSLALAQTPTANTNPTSTSIYCGGGEFDWRFLKMEKGILSFAFNPPGIESEALQMEITKMLLDTSSNDKLPIKELTYNIHSQKEGSIVVKFKKQSCDKLETDEPLNYTCEVISKKASFDGCGSF